MSRFERLIAFRYLRARREEGLISLTAFFSLIGIALGVATLIVVLSVMRGVRSELIDSIIGLEGHVLVYGQSAPLADYDALIEKIKSQPDVAGALPVAQGQVLLSAHGVAIGAQLSGFRAADMHLKPLLQNKIIEGSASGDGILMGQRMAEKMGLHLGDAVTLISPEGRPTLAGMIPRIKTYPITGIFKIGMFAYDNGLVVLPFEEAQTYLKLRDNGGDKTTAIEVMLKDASNPRPAAVAISKLLGSDFRIYDWQSSNAQIFRAVLTQRNVMLMILSLIVLVASFSIVTSLMMLVREKGKAIAILRTMGASRQSILRIFILIGMTIGAFGTALGVALGLTIATHTNDIQSWLESLSGQKMFADELYFLSSLPAKVDSTEVAAVAAIALLLSFLATIYPARRAAKLNPAEALRYE